MFNQSDLSNSIEISNSNYFIPSRPPSDVSSVHDDELDSSSIGDGIDQCNKENRTDQSSNSNLDSGFHSKLFNDTSKRIKHNFHSIVDLIQTSPLASNGKLNVDNSTIFSSINTQKRKLCEDVTNEHENKRYRSTQPIHSTLNSSIGWTGSEKSNLLSSQLQFRINQNFEIPSNQNFEISSNQKFDSLPNTILSSRTTEPKKKERTTFTDYQRQILDYIFQHTQYPDPETTDYLARQLNLHENKIKVWFQNKRSREKKRMNKQARQSNNVPTIAQELPPQLLRSMLSQFKEN
ncbi:hypothetical protein SNEBB_007101 [Seison nebaliae]|nr:hypothetical protein SNEBB_007101 [Seison nebaliae]